jgi:hypothetical protein
MAARDALTWLAHAGEGIRLGAPTSPRLPANVISAKGNDPSTGYTTINQDSLGFLCIDIAVPCSRFTTATVNLHCYHVGRRSHTTSRRSRQLSESITTCI